MIQDAPHISKAAFPESVFVLFAGVLSGRVVTVNDYLAKRDAEWMGQVHEFLGLTVGVVLNDMDHDERKKAYECDITYVTNNELGFDYLRDLQGAAGTA